MAYLSSLKTSKTAVVLIAGVRSRISKFLHHLNHLITFESLAKPLVMAKLNMAYYQFTCYQLVTCDFS